MRDDDRHLHTPLTAEQQRAQLAAEQFRVNLHMEAVKLVEQRISNYETRKWCVEQAVKADAHGVDVAMMSTDILKFITEPFAEIFKDAGS
jgi:hypothetical protein